VFEAGVLPTRGARHAHGDNTTIPKPRGNAEERILQRGEQLFAGAQNFSLA